MVQRDRFLVNPPTERKEIKFLRHLKALLKIASEEAVRLGKIGIVEMIGKDL